VKAWIIPLATLSRSFGQYPLGYLVSLASSLDPAGSPSKTAR